MTHTVRLLHCYSASALTGLRNAGTTSLANGYTGLVLDANLGTVGGSAAQLVDQITIAVAVLNGRKAAVFHFTRIRLVDGNR